MELIVVKCVDSWRTRRELEEYADNWTIDIKGNVIIPFKFEQASVFYHGIAYVALDGKNYCMKNDGILLDYCADCDCYIKK